MATNYLAVAIIFGYYTIVLLLAFWSHSRRRFHCDSAHVTLISTEGRRRRFLRRNLPLILGAGSMTATWVGGGYLNGTAEAVYKNGILHCHAPLGYAISLVIGGTFFAERMRALRPVTMLDPFQHRYGRWMALLLCFPAIAGEVFWTAGVLAALGDSAAAILEVEVRFFVVTSAMVVFFYTSMGGFYAVTRTDVLQIVTTSVCLWICVPACLGSKVVGTVGPPHNNWIGSVTSGDVSPLFDRFLMLVLGGIPWQVYFQRMLDSNTDFDARMVSYLSALGCIALAIPPAVIGAVAKSANFTAAGYSGPHHLRVQDSGRVLPYSIRYLTSGPVSILGMMGITAAILSSVDSSMLSASLLVTKNIYQALLRPTASETEVAIVMRLMVLVIGSSATYLGLSVESVYEAWSLSSELVYVLLFPQLLCLLYFKGSNTYGSLIGFVIGCSFRWLLGRPSLGLPTMGRLPQYHEGLEEVFPVRLISMTLGVVIILLGSYAAEKVFENGWLLPSKDVFRCFRHRSHHREHSSASGTNVMGSKPALQSDAPFADSGSQARPVSHASKVVSEAGMDDGAPNADTSDALTLITKASSISGKSNTMNKMVASSNNALDVSKRDSDTSSARLNTHGSASDGDLSKVSKRGAEVDSKSKSPSATDLRTSRRQGSAGLQSKPKLDRKHSLAWLPMKRAQLEPQLDVESQVKPEASQAAESQVSKKLHRSKPRPPKRE